MEKFSELQSSKYACHEKAQVAREHAKEFLGELLRVKNNRKVYNTLYKNVVE